MAKTAKQVSGDSRTSTVLKGGDITAISSDPIADVALPPATMVEAKAAHAWLQVLAGSNTTVQQMISFETPKAQAIYRGNGVLEVRGKAVSIPTGRRLLEKILDLGGAAQTSDLKSLSSNVSKELSSLADFLTGLEVPCELLTLPGGKNAGGYRTTIVDGREKN